MLSTYTSFPLFTICNKTMDTKLVSHVGTEPEFVHVETQTLNTKSQTPVPRFCQNLTAQACFVMSAGKSRGCCSSWPSHLDIIFCWLVLVCGSACSFATIALMPKCPIQSSAAAQVQQVQPVLMPQLDGAAGPSQLLSRRAPTGGPGQILVAQVTCVK